MFHCDPNDITGIGWALPLISVRQSLREDHLRLISGSDLDEWVHSCPAMDQEMEALARLLLACPVLRALDGSFDLCTTPDVWSLETLLSALPNLTNRLNECDSGQEPRVVYALDIAFDNLLKYWTQRPLRALTAHLQGYLTYDYRFADHLNVCKTRRIVLTLKHAGRR
ncbi:hypothetical protein BKA62DRAFT_671744 [Auriculariales sp. MPI-PUGE-AT-0066]|nr:hypothetical protein BKA62DRAFT_671744 [Auriculariales sp. MPI-PUGE-AT-0066]